MDDPAAADLAPSSCHRLGGVDQGAAASCCRRRRRWRALIVALIILARILNLAPGLVVVIGGGRARGGERVELLPLCFGQEGMCF